MDYLSEKFSSDEKLDLEGINFLNRSYKNLEKLILNLQKIKKIDLMHIAICRLLEPLGYYKFEYVDSEGWPHYKTMSKLPNLKPGEQTVLMKEAIINYFIEKQLIE